MKGENKYRMVKSQEKEMDNLLNWMSMGRYAEALNIT